MKKVNKIKHLRRSIPFFKVLIATRRNRNRVLEAFPQFVFKDLLEILFNVVHGNVKLTKNYKRILAKQRRPQLHLINKFPKSNKSRRHFVYKQKGGFLSALLPIVASIIGGIVGNVA